MTPEQPDGRLEVLTYSAVCLALAVVVGGLAFPSRVVALVLILLALAAINLRYRRLCARVKELEAKASVRDSRSDPGST